MKYSLQTLLLSFLLISTNSFKLNNRISTQVSPQRRQSYNLLAKVDSQLSINDSTSGSTSVLSATALVAGTTVGAGILGLPTVAIEPGFVPSTVALLLCWVYMSATGLLIAEVNSNLQSRTVNSNKSDTSNTANAKDTINNEQIGIVSMSKAVLGNNIELFSSAVYVFIHYALLVAYIAEAGEVLTEQFHLTMYSWIGPTMFASLMSYLFTKSQNTIESVNNFFVVIVITSFIALVILGLTSTINNDFTTLMNYQDYAQLIPAIPVILVALVYHNIVPTICTQLNYNRQNISIAITLGSFIPLVMFIVWNYVILSLLPNSIFPPPTLSAEAITTVPSIVNPIEILITSSQQSSIPSLSTTITTITTTTTTTTTTTSSSNLGIDKSTLISYGLSIFSESAIITSFIGFIFGLKDFYRDVLPSTLKNNQSLLFTLIFIPPWMISVLNPNIFKDALSFAGTYGITVLFCILPAVMALGLRSMYSNNDTSNSTTTTTTTTTQKSKSSNDKADSMNIVEKSVMPSYQPYFPGNNVTLYSIVAVALLIIIQETFHFQF